MAFFAACPASPNSTAVCILARTGGRGRGNRRAGHGAPGLERERRHAVVDDRDVPLDGRSNLLVRYRGKRGTFPHLSAADVMSGRVPRGDAARQNRLRRHDGAWHTRGGGHAARYVVRRRGSSGDHCRQPARAGLHPAICRRDDARQPARVVLGLAVAVAGRGHGRRLRRARRSLRSHRRRCGGARSGCCRAAACSSRRCSRPLA